MASCNSGYAPGLIELFGVGAFDESAHGVGRFTGLCGGSSVLGEQLKLAYVGMRNELTSEERKEVPLEPEPHNCGYGITSKGQFLLTAARETPRLARLREKMLALPANDVRIPVDCRLQDAGRVVGADDQLLGAAELLAQVLRGQEHQRSRVEAG
jgi:hypothetical protein